jgi:heat shock protein HtpX
VFAALAVVMNLGAYFFSDRLVLAMHRARELSVAEAPRLHAMVDELSARAGIPKPRLVTGRRRPGPRAADTQRRSGTHR